MISPSLMTQQDTTRDVQQTTRDTGLLTKIAKLLQLPYYTRTTSLYLYHRTCAAHQYNRDYVILASLSLGMKLEETVKKLADLFIAYRTITIQNTLEPDPNELKKIKDIIMDLERLMLEDLQFDVQIHSPHRFALSTLKMSQADDQVALECWKTLNTIHYTAICIKYPPHFLAMASVMIAYRCMGKEIPESMFGKGWLETCHLDLVKLLGCGMELANLQLESSLTDDEKLKYGRIVQDLKERIPKPEPVRVDRDHRDSRNSRDFHRDNRDFRDRRDSRGRDSRDFRDIKSPSGSRDRRDFRADSRSSLNGRDTRERDNRDGRDNRDIRDSRERDTRDRDSRDRDTRDYQKRDFRDKRRDSFHDRRSSGYRSDRDYHKNR